MPNSITATSSFYKDQLARDSRFLRRLQQIMMQQAIIVINELTTTDGHEARYNYATQVKNNPEMMTVQASFTIVSTQGMQNHFVITDGLPTTDLDDIQLLGVVANAWDTLAGVVKETPAP